MKRFARYAFTLPLIFAGMGHAADPAAPQGPAVRAVLFFSPTCPHCHRLIQEHLPVIFESHGGPPTIRFDEGVPEDQRVFYEVSNGTLQLMLVDVSLPDGGALYRAWAEEYGLRREDWGVPRLVIADTTLVGSRDIPERLPSMIETGLADGGIDWPRIAGFQAALAAIPGYETPPEAEEAPTPATKPEPDPTAEPTPTEESPAGEAARPVTPVQEPVDRLERTPENRARPTVPKPRATEAAAGEKAAEAVERREGGDRSGALALPSRSLTVAQRFGQDPAGNSIAVLVLIGMLASLIGVAFLLRRSGAGGGVGVALPIIALVGALVAAYLTYVETSGATAVCGPVGDCNTVNQSEYAKLLGLVPVGLVGVVGYLVIIGSWIVHRVASGAASDWAALSILGMSIFGTLLSVYLTFLEPFVIGATCAWCLTSAVVITLLMWLSARPGKRAWLQLTRTDQLVA